MRKTVIILFFALMLTITSCTPQNKYLENMGLQIAIGYDYTKDNKISATTVYHSFEPSIKIPVQVMSATAYSSKGVRQSLNLESNKKLVSGQIRIALYGEETAKKSMTRVMDSIVRDPTVGTMIYLAVVEGTANNLMLHKYENIQNIGTYLYNMLKQNIDGEKLISPTLHEFLHDYYSLGGKDPVLPYIKRTGNEVKIVGSAIFKGNHMVGTINMHETFFIKLLRDRFRSGNFEISIPSEKLKEISKIKNLGKNIYVSFSNLKSDTKIRFLKDEKSPIFDVNIKMSIQLNEISNEIDVGDPKVINEIENKVNEVMKQEITRIILKIRKMESDPIGFGKVYKTTVRKDKSKENCFKIYQDANIRVHMKAKILRTGVVD